MSPAPQPTTKPQKGWFRIIITLGNDKEAQRQFIGVDGRDFLIQRGKEVDVPPQVLGVLDDAVMLVDEQDPMDEDKQIQVPRQRFPYTIIRAY